MPSPVSSANENNTGERIGMDCAQEREVLTRRGLGGFFRHSAQNPDISNEERQAASSRKQVTNITKMVDKNMKFIGEIDNGKVPLDQTISAYRSIFQAIVASDEDARRAMITIFSDAALAYFYEHDIEWNSVSEVFGGVLPPVPMSHSRYVDDSNCLIIVSILPFVYRYVLVSRHLLISVRQRKIPRC
jgi:hypothetical protein